MATIQIGKHKLTGAAANIILLALLAAIALLVLRHPPSIHSWPILTAAALWSVMTIYWSKAARNVAADQHLEPVKSRKIHQLLVNGALLLVFVPIPLLREHVLPQWPLLAPVGLAIEACGVLLAVWSRRHLGRNWSGRVSIKVDHQLIRSGPYRLLRHPIYTGFLLMFIGTAVITGELHGLVGVLVVIFAYWRKIRIEEAALSGAFGDAWTEHRRKTWSLVPGIY